MDIIKKAEISQQKEMEMLKRNPEEKKTQNPNEDLKTKNAWPDPMKPEAFYGLAGDFIRLIEPHSEADPVAILVNFLTGIGNMIGNHAYFRIEGDRHCMRLFCMLVGESSKARKGTSWGYTKNIFQTLDETWIKNIQSGMSSGEGLIWAVRDRNEKDTDTVDEGVNDKRLLILESEFSSVLRVLGREGNTLSAIIRNAWDSGDLQTLTKTSQARATNTHISILGHTTKEEVIKYLSETEMANGFGNRFLWFCVRRSKTLPFGGNIQEVDFQPILNQLKDMLTFAASVEQIKWADETRALWAFIYPTLSEGKPGLFGSMIARAEAYVTRLASLYALLDKSDVITPDHLKAALAVWDYSENSAKYIFYDMTGSELADDILTALSEAPDGLTKTDINNKFGRHKSSFQLTEALNMLQGLGLIEHKIESTEGRSKEIWYLSDQEHSSQNSLNSHKGYLEKLKKFMENNKGVPPISNL